MKRLVLFVFTYLFGVPHLIIKTNDSFRVDQFLGHHQVEPSDLIEFIQAALAVQTADFVLEAGQPNIGVVVQTRPRFTSTTGISAPGTPLTIIETCVWSLKQT